MFCKLMPKIRTSEKYIYEIDVRSVENLKKFYIKQIYEIVFVIWMLMEEMKNLCITFYLLIFILVGKSSS